MEKWRFLNRGILLSLVFICLTSYSFNQEKLKVYISVDMEGIAGVVHSDQTSSSGKDYNLARKWTTEETNAAIKGALEAGATEIVVNDSHGSKRNIIASMVNPAAYLITGSPKPLGMMQGIDETFDAIIFIGYHSKVGTKDAVLDHTMSGSAFASISINGVEMSEAQINAALGAVYDVPVVLITGDATVCEQTKEELGEELETAVVKEAVGRTAAKTLTPEKACILIKEKTKIALQKKNWVKPYKLDPPFRFEINFNRSSMADMAEFIPQIERVNPRKVRFESEDFIQGFKLMRALMYIAR
jgi:D-amino peptidase